MNRRHWRNVLEAAGVMFAADLAGIIVAEIRHHMHR